MNICILFEYQGMYLIEQCWLCHKEDKFVFLSCNGQNEFRVLIISKVSLYKHEWCWVPTMSSEMDIVLDYHSVKIWEIAKIVNISYEHVLISCMNIWIWESYQQNGCHICSQLVKNRITWPFWSIFHSNSSEFLKAFCSHW